MIARFLGDQRGYELLKPVQQLMIRGVPLRVWVKAYSGGAGQKTCWINLEQAYILEGDVDA